MQEHFLIREDIPAYMADLKKWLEEIREQPLEEMTEFFADRLEEYEDHMAFWADAYRQMGRLIPEQAGTLLDLGCGTGLELEEIFRRNPGLAVTGIDLSAEMLGRLQEKFPQVKTVCGDYFSTDFGEKQFDAAVSFETLHHFKPEKKEALFEKIRRALKPGGVYIQADYLACCEEEEKILMDFSRKKREEQGIAEDVFVHFDTPLTAEHEMALLRQAGFSRLEWGGCIKGAAFLKAWTECV